MDKDFSMTTKDTSLSPIRQLLSQVSLGSTLIYGEPVQNDHITIIPVSKVKVGFGYGQGRGAHSSGEGMGGGGGLIATPIGYIEIRGKKAVFKPIRPFLKSIIAAGLTGLLLLTLLRRAK
jgi:uncharacterized spore protein YtfJ